MATSFVTDRDLGMKKLLRDLKKLPDELAVYVGIQGKAGSELVTRGAANEFGTEDKRIPERSFLRSTVDDNRREYNQDLAQIVGAAVDGRTPLKRGMSILGEKVVGAVKETIRDLKDPPNAQRTKDQKGTDNPLIETGQMRNSISYEVK